MGRGKGWRSYIEAMNKSTTKGSGLSSWVSAYYLGCLGSCKGTEGSRSIELEVFTLITAGKSIGWTDIEGVCVCACFALFLFSFLFVLVPQKKNRRTFIRWNIIFELN